MMKWLCILLTSLILLLPVACTRYDYDQADTPANQAGFEQHFGFPSPGSVTGIYYYADDMGVDVIYQMAFEADPTTIERIVNELNLVQKELDFQNNLARDFGWWDEATIEGLLPYWKGTPDKDYYWFLWYDPESQRAYYLEFSL